MKPRSLKDKLKEKQGKQFDIAVFASGGKDSSYVLCKVIENMEDPGRVLAVTMENGFMSDGARKNLRVLQAKLGFEHEYWSINQDVLFSFYRRLTKHGNPRSVCIGCNILSERMTYEALSKYMPALFVTGNSQEEYENFASWLKKKDIKDAGSGNPEFEYRHGMWAYNERILKEVLDEDSAEYLALACPEPRLDDGISQCERIVLFDFYQYKIGEIMETLHGLGWIQPKDVIGTETDCVFTQAITHVLLESKGKEAYLRTLNDMVKSGLPKEDKKRAIERLHYYNPALAKDLLEKVGFCQHLNSAINDLLPIR